MLLLKCCDGRRRQFEVADVAALCQLMESQTQSYLKCVLAYYYYYYYWVISSFSNAL